MEVSFKFAENVIGIVLEEKLDKEKLAQIRKMVLERLEQFPKIRVYIEDKNDCGADISALLEDLRNEYTDPPALEKLAVVTDSKLGVAGARLKDLLVEGDVKSFSRKERLEALNWVTE